MSGRLSIYWGASCHEEPSFPGDRSWPEAGQFLQAQEAAGRSSCPPPRRPVARASGVLQTMVEPGLQ